MKMTQEELAEVLELHGKWLRGEEGGERADLTNAILTGAILRGADLTNAILTGAILTGADLTGAILTGAVLTGAILRDAVLTGAILRDAVLTGAILRGAVLRRAILRGAVLRRAILRGAILTGAVLTGADLRGAVYCNAVGNRQHIKSMQLERYGIAYTHDRLQIGCQQHAIADWWQFGDARINAMDSGALEWWRKWKPILQQIIDASPAEPTSSQLLSQRCPMTENTPQGWRDMASAPRDGTPVLLRSNDTGLTYCAGWTVLGSDRGARWQSTMLDQGGYSDEYFDGWMPMPHPDTGFADSLVVGDGLVDDMARQLWSWCTGGSPEYWDNETDDSCTEEEGQQFTQMARHCLTAALPHAKTEAQVREEFLEQLAHYAAQEAKSPLHSNDAKRRWKITADWLRSQKGQTND